ncbi:MAG: 4-alpha-glucanotransferase [Actinomycetota bacterium]|nr:MAG: 4-alpha-glucanotransferase [Actinomycetota bacterium]
MSAGLAELAEAYGVATSYRGQDGRHVVVGADTVEAVLQVFGVDCSDGGIAAALAEVRLRPWRRTLPAVQVAVAGEGGHVRVHVRHGTAVQVYVEPEGDGPPVRLGQVDRWVEPVEVDGHLVGEATFAISRELPPGWHTLVATTDDQRATCPLVLTPRRLREPVGPRQWGIMAQLYQARSRRSWGVGDLADLADLAAWSAHHWGADFVLVNPLHAASPVPPMEPSPYLPVTRRFANPLYLRVEDIEEFGYLSPAARQRVSQLARAVQADTVAADLIDRDRSWAAKAQALELVRAVPRTPGRQAVFEAYLDREADGLVDFATWCALVETYGADAADWPPGLSSPHDWAVAAERTRLADRIAFHCWIQWVLDEQLATAQRAAITAGMRTGVVHDLAVGVHPGGADAWALGELLAQGMSVGAPPDMYNQLGQNWSQPPWRPDALAEAGYAPYRDMLRTILRHAGGIRVDHVLGLFRLWWVPAGQPASAGTYVRYDHDALVGILVLEAARAGAFVVGEDLGTLEPWVQDYLGDRGVLGTSILWFEADGEVVRPPATWRQRCLASITVHDLPPTAGFLAGEHVRIRSDLGLLTRPEAAEQAAHAADLGRWTELLVRHGWLAADRVHDTDEVVLALHRGLASSPSLLLGVALPDLVGDRRAQNQPGTYREYPNWQLPLHDGAGRPVLLDDLPDVDLVRRVAGVLRGERGRP